MLDQCARQGGSPGTVHGLPRTAIRTGVRAGQVHIKQLQSYNCSHIYCSHISIAVICSHIGWPPKMLLHLVQVSRPLPCCNPTLRPRSDLGLHKSIFLQLYRTLVLPRVQYWLAGSPAGHTPRGRPLSRAYPEAWSPPEWRSKPKCQRKEVKNSLRLCPPPSAQCLGIAHSRPKALPVEYANSGLPRNIASAGSARETRRGALCGQRCSEPRQGQSGGPALKVAAS